MDANLKNITKLCKDIHTLCQNGTQSVRLAAQLGLQELYDRLSGMPKPLSSPGDANGNANANSTAPLDAKDLKNPVVNRIVKSSIPNSPSDSFLQPKNASPSVIPFKALSKEELSYIGKLFEKKVWPSGTLLFNQGDDRKYFYMIESGTIEKFKNVFGKKVKLIDLGKYDTIGEEIFLDKTTHSSSAQCLTEVSTWVLSNESWEIMADENPKLAIKLMKNAANVMRYRLLYPAKAYIAVEDFARRADVRHEKDSIGEFELPSQAYYGVQTARAIENFPITGIKLCQFPRFIEALCYIKKAAAITNHRLGAISEEKRDAIGAACDEIVGGKLHGHFVVDMVQGGAGTSTNMNANEVIANRGLELMGKQKGQYEFLHPNNDINHAQSTNDVYPSAIHIATLLSAPQLDESLSDLANALSAKAKEFSDILKMGRTQLQDAVPMTLGQAFEAWAQMIRDERERLKVATSLMEEINMGATAIGTGINAHPAYSGLVIYELNQLTGLHLRPSPNLIMATQDTGAFLNFSSFLKNCCVRLSKISNDLRLLSSGPRCGLGEINLPAVQPGSSIMPGKVNPVIPEVVNQTSFFVMGADFANTMASEAGQMELNAMEPLMAFLIFQSIDMISSAIATLIRNCIVGITPNVEKCTWYVMNSTGIVTALNPYIGYDNAARIAKTSLKTGKRVYDLVLEEKLLSKDQLDEIMQPDKMTKPREISKNKHWRKLSNTLESVSFFFKELEKKKEEEKSEAKA